MVQIIINTGLRACCIATNQAKKCDNIFSYDLAVLE